MGMFVGSEDTEVTVGSPGPRMMLGALGGDKGQKMSTRPREFHPVTSEQMVHDKNDQT